MAYTSFFRDSDALRAIEQIAMPALANRRETKVWDAGCATGEEPYTLAMLFASRMGPFTFRNLDILATDHEESDFPQFAERVREALYSRTDVFWVPSALREKYFLPTEDPEEFLLVQEIRDKVRYLRHDLLSFAPPERDKSMIVCKNVLMHFGRDDQLNVLAMFRESLEPGGFLVLDGNQGMPGEFSRIFVRCMTGLPLFRISGG